MHAGMTGSLRWLEGGAPEDRYDCVVFVTGTGELRYPSPELRTSRHSPRPTGNHDVIVGEPVGIPAQCPLSAAAAARRSLTSPV
jgi:hypothetical protein